MSNRYSVRPAGYRHAKVIPTLAYRKAAVLALHHSIRSPAEAQVIELELMLLGEEFDEV